MPTKGAASRASQQATLSGMAHEAATNPELEEIVNELLAGNSLSELERSNIERTQTDIGKRKKFSREFVEEMSRAISDGFQAWHVAKRDNNYSIFEPKLDKLIALKRKEAK